MPRKKTPQEYYNECKEKGLDLPIESYSNSYTKIKHKCKKGHIYLQRPNDHLRNNSCPYCAKNIKKTPKQYYTECKEKCLDLPIEHYVNIETKIKHKCKKGHIYLQRPNEHLRGQGCPKCYQKSLHTYRNEWKTLNLDKPISNTYVDNKHKLLFKCNKGHVYEQLPNQHKFYGCPICNESHGEKYIRNYLDKSNIFYEAQKTFNGLKDKTYLSYDFYLPKYNILIEYQGIQHYKPKDYFGGEEQFKLQQLHDKMKKDYAKKNNYKLLELHYSLDTQEKVNRYLERRIK